MLAWCYLLILVILIFYIGVGINCGRMRVRHNIPAPSTVGHPEFERAFRVQMNTIEHMVPFLPAMAICALVTSATIAFWLGLAWLIGRVWYAVGYMTAADKRGPGFMISFLSLLLAIIAALYGVIGLIAQGHG